MAAATFSSGTPTARSPNPSPSMSPAARDVPKRSLRSGVSGTSVPWSSTRAFTGPLTVPASTCTAPASASVSCGSPGTPTARSSRSSPSKRPDTSANPNSSPASAVSSIPALFCVMRLSPSVLSPDGDPNMRWMAPAPAAVPTVSPGTPTTRSSSGPPPTSAATSADPKRSSTSAVSTTARGVLVPALAAGGRQARTRPVQDDDLAGVLGRADVRARRGHGEVVEPVAVEVARRQRGPESRYPGGHLVARCAAGGRRRRP